MAIALGRMAAGEIEKSILFIEDPAVVKHIDDLGQSLAQKSTRKGITYTFKVVDSPELIVLIDEIGIQRVRRRGPISPQGEIMRGVRLRGATGFFAPALDWSSFFAAGLGGPGLRRRIYSSD